MKRMRIVVVMAGLLAGTAAAYAAGSGLLDQTSWKMRVTGIGRLLFWRSDRLDFKDGAFICERCRKNGFLPVSYAITNPSEFHWVATLTNENGESMVWEGRLERSMMRGNYTWIKSGHDGAKKVVGWTAQLIKN